MDGWNETAFLEMQPVPILSDESQSFFRTFSAKKSHTKSV